MFNEYPDIMTPREVADALHIGMNSVYSMLHNKEIGYKRIGKKYIIPKACLISYVKSAHFTVKPL